MINIILQMGEGKHTHERERLVQSYTRSDPSGRTRGEVVTNDVCSGLWERWGGTKDQSLKVGTKPLTWEYYKLFC